MTSLVHSLEDAVFGSPDAESWRPGESVDTEAYPIYNTLLQRMIPMSNFRSGISHKSSFSSTNIHNYTSFQTVAQEEANDPNVCAGTDYAAVCPTGWEHTTGNINGRNEGTICKKIARKDVYADDNDSEDALTPEEDPKQIEMKTVASRLFGRGRLDTGENPNNNPESLPFEKFVNQPAAAGGVNMKEANRALARLPPNCVKKWFIRTGVDDDKNPALFFHVGGGGANWRKFLEKQKQIGGSSVWGRLKANVKGTLGLGYEKLWPTKRETTIISRYVQNKRMMELDCNMKFPCTKSGGWRNDFSTITRNICPQGWKMDPDSGNCYARDRQSCAKLSSIKVAGIRGLMSSQQNCEVCKSDKNDPQMCKLYNSGAYGTTGCVWNSGQRTCEPKYNGPCLAEKPLWFYTPRMKDFFARTCKADWPLKKLPGVIVPADTLQQRTARNSTPEKMQQAQYNDQVLQLLKVTSSLAYNAVKGLGSSFMTLLKDQASQNLDMEDSNLPNDCERDYKQACPVNWAINKDGICFAPPDYSGVCPSRMDFRGLTEEMKKSVSGHCNVAYPCMNELIVPRYHPFSLDEKFM